jgi:signal transduction histidine kinase
MAPRQARDPKRSEAARRLAKLACRVLVCRTVSIVAVEPETALLHPITIIGLSPTQEARWWASWDRQQHLGERFDPGAVAALRAGKLVTPARVRLPLRPGQYRVPAYTVLLVPMQVGDTLLGVLVVERGGGQNGAPSPHWQALIRAAARLGALVLDRERRLHERAVALARELALRETNAQMDTFVGIAGHEMKSPLTGVMLSLYLIERRIQRVVGREPAGANVDAEPLAKPLLEQVALAEQQVERLGRLVNDLLDATRARAGKLEIHPEPADLALLVREVVQEQRQLAPARDLLLQAPVALHVPVIADGERSKQVVTNYLTNALKYSPADRPVAVGIAVDDREARVWVRDEGPGLPTEEQERIWERFQRARGIAVQSGSGIGLGLGLYICRTIIERHHGQVGVESAVGRGSTFWFTVPLARRGVQHACVPRALQETPMSRHP